MLQLRTRHHETGADQITACVPEQYYQRLVSSHWLYDGKKAYQRASDWQRRWIANSIAAQLNAMYRVFDIVEHPSISIDPWNVARLLNEISIPALMDHSLQCHDKCNGKCNHLGCFHNVVYRPIHDILDRMEIIMDCFHETDVISPLASIIAHYAIGDSGYTGPITIDNIHQLVKDGYRFTPHEYTQLNTHLRSLYQLSVMIRSSPAWYEKDKPSTMNSSKLLDDIGRLIINESKYDLRNQNRTCYEFLRECAGERTEAQRRDGERSDRCDFIGKLEENDKTETVSLRKIVINLYCRYIHDEDINILPLINLLDGYTDDGE